jgi:phage terminase Nu1 subunit (DNA packaging protein)
VAARPHNFARASPAIGRFEMSPKAKASDGPEPLEGEIPVTLDRAAAICGVTEKTIRSWINDGLQVMQQGKRGRSSQKTIVDLAAVLRWYLEQDALDAAKTRLASAQADKHEMENALRRGELADVKDVQREWSDMVLACRSKLLTLPTKLAPQVTNVADAAIIAARLRAEIGAALLELATNGADGGPEEPTPRRRKSAAAAARPNGKSVGRREAQA